MRSQGHEDAMAIVLSEDIWQTALECLLETAGLTAALPILQPISEWFGKLSGQGQICGIKPSENDEIISCECLLAEIRLGGRARGKIHENGAQIHASGCKLEGRCPEICFLCCQMIGEAYTNGMHPAYDHLLVESLSNGDSKCGWILRKRGETPSDLGGRLPFLRHMPEEGEIEAVRILLQEAYVETWKLITEALVQIVGEERAVLALEKSMRSLGMVKGKEYSSALGIEDSDIDSVGHLIKRVLDLLKIARMDAYGGKELGKESTISNSFSRLRLLICFQIEAFCGGVLEAINPDYEPSYDKAIGLEEQWCH